MSDLASTLKTPSYRGRFAPSPTGPLHYGSLLTALASWLRARAVGGEWLVRIEDIDPPREQAGAAGDILRTLERYGLYWDGEPLFQSTRLNAYRSALAELQDRQIVYPCTCSRKTLKESATHFGIEGAIYAGTCRSKQTIATGSHCWRINCANASIRFNDLLQGEFIESIGAEYGDYVLWRSADLPSYQLAVVIDDEYQQVTEVVRGMDLISTTSRQCYLQTALGFKSLNYIHVPVVVGSDKTKLSKQTGATPLPTDNIASTLCSGLASLGLKIDRSIQGATPEEILHWATQHFRPEHINPKRTIPLTNWQLSI